MEKVGVKTLAGMIVYSMRYKIFDFDE